MAIALLVPRKRDLRHIQLSMQDRHLILDVIQAAHPLLVELKLKKYFHSF
jgi:hypothetical protein